MAPGLTLVKCAARIQRKEADAELKGDSVSCRQNDRRLLSARHSDFLASCLVGGPGLLRPSEWICVICGFSGIAKGRVSDTVCGQSVQILTHLTVERGTSSVKLTMPPPTSSSMSRTKLEELTSAM